MKFVVKKRCLLNYTYTLGHNCLDTMETIISVNELYNSNADTTLSQHFSQLLKWSIKKQKRAECEKLRPPPAVDHFSIVSCRHSITDYIIKFYT